MIDCKIYEERGAQRVELYVVETMEIRPVYIAVKHQQLQITEGKDYVYIGLYINGGMYTHT